MANKKKKSDTTTSLAKAFHQYLCDNPDVLKTAVDRNGAHHVFQEWHTNRRKEQEKIDNDDAADRGGAPQQPDDGEVPHDIPKVIQFDKILPPAASGGNNHKQNVSKKLLFLESQVMARLRQLKVLRSKRHRDSVLMIFADRHGAFPPAEQQRTEREQLVATQAEEQRNKHGVVVGYADAPTVAIGQPATLVIPVSTTAADASPATDEEKEDASFVEGLPPSPPVHVTLQSVTLRGPRRNAFAIQNNQELQEKMPCNVDEGSITVHVTLTPKSTSVYRSSLRCTFLQSDTKQTFVVVRPLMVRGTLNVEMEKALQPTTPYTRRKYKQSRKPEAEIGPPPREDQNKKKKTNKQNSEDRDDISRNPFSELPMETIPSDVLNLLEAGELEQIIESPSQVSQYGDFWKHLLWTSEWQAYRDIQLFDMEDVQLHQEGRFMVLSVPGLAENRPSVLRGDLVHITWGETLYKGRVHTARSLDVLLELHPKFHQTFNTSLDTVSVRFTLSRMTLRTSHHGCGTKAPIAMGPAMLMPTKEVVQDVLNPTLFQPREAPSKWAWANPRLNDEQRAAVQNIVTGQCRPMPYCIFGPPGTGKTTTVIEAVYQLARHKSVKRILLVAPSNDAADVLVERLANHFPPSEMRRIMAYSRSLENVPDAIRSYVDEKLGSEQQTEAILGSRIVVSTVNLSARFSWMQIPEGHFDVLVIDEAGHATEPEVVSVAATLMDFWKPERGQLVLAGDPQQLGPIVSSELCRNFGMSESYMERLMKTDVYARQDNDQYPVGLVTKLVQNYRSHTDIIKLPNEMFYDGELKCCADEMVAKSMAKWEHLPTKGFPILFHATTGENLREGNSPSWFNPQEAIQVVEYVKLLTTKESKPRVKEEDIGIITPYHRQAQKIRLALAKASINDVKVGSVEIFQGQERRCIIVSTVRSEADHLSHDLRYNLGFVANEKRFNVAITRAQALLIVIGCPDVLALDKKNWLPFLKFCHERKGWAGEEWDPAQAEMQDLSLLKSAPDAEDEAIEQQGPSHNAAEGFAYVHQEE